MPRTDPLLYQVMTWFRIRRPWTEDTSVPVHYVWIRYEVLCCLPAREQLLWLC
jgi:hypothetical protein